MSIPNIQSVTNTVADQQEDENPFVGLRPYEAEESYLFFGRGKQTTELLQKLYTTRFIGVVGSSGCGKSSLIKAGLIPKLKAGFLTKERDHWVTASMRPAGNPLLFLAESICSALSSSPFINDEYSKNPDCSSSLLKTIHEKGGQGIIDVINQVFEKSPCNLLLLVDQFEELFTTKRHDTDIETQMNENVLFVNILLSLSRQKDLPVYVVITMRSDYIGNCNKFYGLPETLNEGQYLVPRLNRQQLNEVIELPIKLYGEKISARLLDQILNESDKDLDQLPVLQHALMRTFKFWQLKSTPGVIDFEDYEAAGKLDKALSNHANEVYEKLDGTQKKIAELVFRSLTDVNAENIPIRRRQSLGQLTEVCRSIKNISPRQVEEVINKFRDRDCSFITPFSGKINDSTIIDISHESLMRQWDKLKIWMKDEQSSGRKFKWLTESVNNQRESLRGIDLNDALLWKLKQPANEEWASRYQGNYKVVETYIENSRRKARNNRILKNAIIGIFIIAPLALYALYQRYNLKNLKYRNEITRQYRESLEHKNDSLKISLLQLDSNLLSQKKLKEDLVISYENQKKMAMIKAESDMRAERLRDENDRRERRHQQEESNRVEIEGLKLHLKQEPFYVALYNENNQNFEYGDAVVNALADSYNKDKNEYSKFYQAITQVFKAKEIAQEDPITALRMSKKARELSKNPMIDSNIKKVISNNIYYKQKIVPSPENRFSAPSLFIFNDKTSFAINDVSNNMFTGQLKKDSLSMNEAFTYSYRNSFSPKDTSNKPYIAVKTFSLNDKTILRLEDDGKLSGYTNDKKTEIGNIPDIDKSTIAEFSPDQRYLVTASSENIETHTKKDSTVTLWDIGDLKNSVPAKIILDSNNTRVKQIAFSSDSRLCFVLDANFLKIYNIRKKRIVNTIPGISAAQFSENNNYVIAISSRGSLLIFPDSISSPNQFKSIRLENRYVLGLKSFSLSPDWKKILLKQDGKLFILEKEGGDSVLSTNYNYTQPLKLNSKYFSVDKNLVNTASFISNNSILSVNDDGNVFLWKTYSDFKNIDTALSSIQLPDLSIAEKLEEGHLTFDDIKSSKDEYTLREAATYFERKSHEVDDYNGKNQDIFFNRAQLLYNELLSSTSGDKKLYYLDKITSLSRNYSNSRSPDSADHRKIVNRLNKNVELLDSYNTNNPGNTALVKQLSMDYNALSFHLLFVREYEKTIEACDKGLKMNPKYDVIYTNKALALLLSKKFPEAQKYYEEYKDKWIESMSRMSFKEGFLQDFGDLQEAGIINPKEKDVYNKVEEIRKMLENVVVPVKNNKESSAKY